MPTSARQNAPVFTEIFGESAAAQRVDVGIDPYTGAAAPERLPFEQRGALYYAQTRVPGAGTRVF